MNDLNIAGSGGRHSGLTDSAGREIVLPPATFDDEAAGGTNLDIRSLYGILRRNIILLATVVILVLAIGLTLTLLTTPTYVAASSVQIEQQGDQVLSTQDSVEPAASYQDAERFLKTQTDILRSRAMAIRVGNEQKLFHSEFIRQMNESVPEPRPGMSDERAIREAVIDILSDNLSVTLPADSRVVTISFRSPSPKVAADIANTYSQQFISANLQRKYDSSAYARNFLSKRLIEAKSRLEDSERELNRYAREAGLIDTSRAAGNSDSNGANGSSITAADLVQINQAANNAQAQRIAAEQQWASAKNTPLMALPQVIGNDAIQALQQRRAEAQAQLDEELARHQEAYPTVVRARSLVDSLDGQITNLAETIRASLREQYQSARRQEESLNQQVQQLTSATQAEQDRSVRYNILRREVETNRTLYDGLLQRYKELSAAAGVTTNNISVVDEAVAPIEPDSPKLVLNMALALLTGLTLGLVAVFIREQIDDVVRSPDDVERKLGIQSLGTIPDIPQGATVVEELASPRSAISEAYYALRTSLLYATEHGLPRSLLVTSTQASEGKSTTALALARDMARLGKRTLLIDIDLRRPSLHKTLNFDNGIGLSSILTGQSDQDVVRASETPNLMFITSGPLPPSPTELLGGERLTGAIRDFEKQYDVVVFDGPPVLGLADAPMISAITEGTLFVVEANRGYHGRAKTALRRLRDAHSNLLGVVLTKFNARAAGVGQEYSYDYYRYGHDDPEDE